MSEGEWVLSQRRIPEYGGSGGRLGRNVVHDSRSRSFQAPRATTIRSVRHKSRGLPLDQGDLGSCTGNAMVGALNTSPLRKWWRCAKTEQDAVDLYERATLIDPFPGEYPPEDTGSAGLYVAKAAQEKGWIKNYSWAFGLEHTLQALTLRPVIIGIGWYSSFDRPDDVGRIRITSGADIRGGHEVLLTGLSTARGVVFVMNSWGKGYGIDGAVELGFEDLDRLLQEDGDCVQVS
jgi:hypothetical protein